MCIDLPTLSSQEAASLRDVEQRHEDDWTDYRTYAALATAWHWVADLVADSCDCDPAEYTHDLFVRDSLERLLAQCPEPLRSKLAAPVLIIDARFIAATEPDTERLLWGWHDHAEPGFWWLRIPRRGGVVVQMREDRAFNRRELAQWRAFAQGRSIYDVP